MKNLYGVIQGRLLPKYLGRYQAHPVDYWQDEFPIARELGLDCIEFILDYNDAEKNPLLRSGGVDEILSVSERTGVSAGTICADYLMEAPIHAEDEDTAKRAVDVLGRLIRVAGKLEVTDIVIPCVDQSSFKDAGSIERLKQNLGPLLDLAENVNVNLSLEADLAPAPFHELLEQFDSARLTVNYDIGNSAGLGFDPIEELDAYGERISDIHIKDRTLGGGPVVLGEGDADFSRFFRRLKPLNYSGPFIMQAYRDDEGISVFKDQVDWIKPYLDGLSEPRQTLRHGKNL